MIPTFRIGLWINKYYFFPPFYLLQSQNWFFLSLPTPHLKMVPKISYNSNLRLVSPNKEFCLAPCLVLYCTVV